jgi:hypothetical protein
VKPTLNDRNKAMLALGTLLMTGTIAGYRTNFRDLDAQGVAPHVTVTIAAYDELAIERTKRAVRRALEPCIIGVEVTVEPGFLLGGAPADRFNFSSDDEVKP